MDQDYEGAATTAFTAGPFWARGGENTVGMSWPLPDVEETKRLTARAGGKMAMMAIAPGNCRALMMIRYLHAQGIKVACCLTAAHSREIYDALEHSKGSTSPLT